MCPGEGVDLVGDGLPVLGGPEMTGGLVFGGLSVGGVVGCGCVTGVVEKIEDGFALE